MAQELRKAIRSSAMHPAHAASVIGDGLQHCAYPELPGLLAGARGYLDDNGLQRGDVAILELSNTLPAALTLLTALDGELDFMVLPVEGQGVRGGGHEVGLPSFARWVISARATRPPAPVDLRRPSSWLQIRANSAWRPANALPQSSTPRLLYRTSGSLGTPKLVMTKHETTLANVLAASLQLGLNCSHRVAIPIPIFHGFALGVGLLGSVTRGASIDLQERGNLLHYFEREADFNPDVAFMTPSFCQMLLRVRRRRRPYRLIVTGGDCISPALHRDSELRHGPTINGYGSTEMGFVAAWNSSLPAETRGDTIGSPVDGVTLRIVAGENSADGTGELQVRSAHAFIGYVDLAGKAVESTDRYDQGWFRTGDLAQPGPQNTIRVLGRCDLSINRNGVLLPFADVENRLNALPGVEEAAVVAGAETIRGRGLVAFCVVARGHILTGEQLRTCYADGAPAYSVPDAIHILPELPRLATGKVDRRALSERLDGLPLHNETPSGNSQS